MNNKYDFIIAEGTLPIKSIILRIDDIDFHWHNEFEFIFVLEGNIDVYIKNEVYSLKENDVILINEYEIHSIKKRKEKNMILVLKVDPDFYNDCFPRFKNLRFHCKSFPEDSVELEKFDIIRSYIANIAWYIIKKNKGYELMVGSYLYLLGDHLLNNFSHELVKNKKHYNNKDVSRINNIINYINDNISRNITLKEIAEKFHFNYHFLSHFIKDNIGMSFQEYLNKIRLDKAVNMIASSNINISDIAISTGFSSTSYFNKLFKKKYKCSPSEYRELLNFNSNEFKPNNNNNKSRIYFETNDNNVFKKLYPYLSIPHNKNNDIDSYFTNNEHVHIDLNCEGKKLNHYWKKLSTFYKASVGLSNNVQYQFREFQREIEFEYIRVSGLFMEDMMIYNLSEDGKLSYNWIEVDKILDLLKEVNVKPFIEMDFIYESKNFNIENKDYRRKVNVPPSINISLWSDIILEFLKHSVNRYGLKEVETWYFDVWNYPDYNYFHSYGRVKEYLDYYKKTIKIIKSISENCKVGGPSINNGTMLEKKWLLDSIDFCKKNNIYLDFLSVNIHTEYVELEELEGNILHNTYYKDKHKFVSQIKKYTMIKTVQ